MKTMNITEFYDFVFAKKGTFDFKSDFTRNIIKEYNLNVTPYEPHFPSSCFEHRDDATNIHVELAGEFISQLLDASDRLNQTDKYILGDLFVIIADLNDVVSSGVLKAHDGKKYFIIVRKTEEIAALMNYVIPKRTYEKFIDINIFDTENFLEPTAGMVYLINADLVRYKYHKKFKESKG